jgi:SAM-dependent methyltransferase
MVLALSVALHAKPIILPDWPRRFEIRGLGLSDWSGMEEMLCEKISFVNTFFHRDPYLDIRNIPRDLEGRFDFVFSSEVFEHVDPPVERSFEGAFKLIKPGGALILSVPHYEREETIEHFPGASSYQVLERDGEWLVEAKDDQGVTTVYRDVVFHGGGGSTLEMRQMAAKAITKISLQTGFSESTPFDHDFPDHGIIWKRPHSMWPYLISKANNGSFPSPYKPPQLRAQEMGLYLDSNKEVFVLMLSEELRIYPERIKELKELDSKDKITVGLYAPSSKLDEEILLLERAVFQAGVDFEELPDLLLISEPAGRATDWASIADCFYTQEILKKEFLSTLSPKTFDQLRYLINYFLDQVDEEAHNAWQNQ